MAKENGTPPTEHEILATFAWLGAGAMPILNATLSFAAVAYVIGWWQARTYLEGFQAKWVVSLLSPAELLTWSIAPVVAFIWMLLLVSLVLGARKDPWKGTQKLWWAGVGISLAAGVAARFLPGGWSLGFATLASYSWALLASVTLYQLALRASDASFRWDSRLVYNLAWMTFQAFFFGPSVLAYAESERDRAVETSTLSCVYERSAANTMEWRLLGTTGEQAILVSLRRGEEPPPIRVVDIGAAGEIRPCAKPSAASAGAPPAEPTSAPGATLLAPLEEGAAATPPATPEQEVPK